MRNRYLFFGIRKPDIVATLKTLVATREAPVGKPLRALVEQLWSQKERECHHFALELLRLQRNTLSIDDLPLLESLVARNAWWDTVDCLATQLISPILLDAQTQHREIGRRWIAHSDFWIRRVALLYQLKWKAQLDFPHLQTLIRATASENEFFIQKAIGWILREYSKTDANAVSAFVAATPLAPLSRREALKWLDRNR